MMEVLAINGSPKGKNSVTLQNSRYFEIPCPDRRFLFFHAATRLPSRQRDFPPAAEGLKKTAWNLERGRSYV